jgi:hypothetical protein
MFEPELVVQVGDMVLVNYYEVLVALGLVDNHTTVLDPNVLSICDRETGDLYYFVKHHDLMACKRNGSFLGVNGRTVVKGLPAKYEPHVMKFLPKEMITISPVFFKAVAVSPPNKRYFLAPDCFDATNYKVGDIVMPQQRFLLNAEYKMHAEFFGDNNVYFIIDGCDVMAKTNFQPVEEC